MRFLFVVPFRTNINNFEEVNKCINSSLEELLSSLPEGYFWQTFWHEHNSGELRYSELSEDYIPFSSTPICRLKIYEKHIIPIISDNLNQKLCEIESINDLFIDYYDNTIAILFIDVGLNFINDISEAFSKIDKFSVDFSCVVINQIKTLEHQLQAKLVSKNESLFKKQKNFNIFFDRKNTSKDIQNGAKEILWVTRIFFNYDDISTSILEDWSQQTELNKKKIKIGQTKINFSVGNSIIHNKMTGKEFYSFITSLSTCMYFYVLYDVLNKNLKNLFNLLSTREKISLTLASQVNKFRNYLEFIDNEFSDFIIGLQGLRKLFANHFLEIWKYYDLVDLVHKKNNIVCKMLDYALMEKNNKYTRAIQAILAAIGAIAILDFTLNLFSFSNNAELSNDNITGFIDVARYLSPDLTLYVLIALIFVLIYTIVKKGS